MTRRVNRLLTFKESYRIASVVSNTGSPRSQCRMCTIVFPFFYLFQLFHHWQLVNSTEGYYMITKIECLAPCSRFFIHRTSTSIDYNAIDAVREGGGRFRASWNGQASSHERGLGNLNSKCSLLISLSLCSLFSCHYFLFSPRSFFLAGSSTSSRTVARFISVIMFSHLYLSGVAQKSANSPLTLTRQPCMLADHVDFSQSFTQRYFQSSDRYLGNLYISAHGYPFWRPSWGPDILLSPTQASWWHARSSSRLVSNHHHIPPRRWLWKGRIWGKHASD